MHLDLDPDADGLGIDLALPAGRSVHAVPVKLPRAGPQQFRAVFEPAGAGADVVTENNEALSVTFSHLFRKPYTVQYPDRLAVRVQDTLPYRYRGILEVDLEICTGCLACERACPIDCIVIDAVKDKATKEMILRRFDIDIAKCMFCGLCSEPCPTGSIHHTREFEGADYRSKAW